jgi:hypothetical protein
MDDEKPPAIREDDSVEQQKRGRPFERGVSGNPRGRPKGSRNRVTLLAEMLLEDQAEALIRKFLDKAKDGDMVALRFVMENLLPRRRDRFVSFEFDEIRTPADAAKASGAVLAACARGELTPDEATKFMDLITAHTETLEIVQLQSEMTLLKQQVLSLAPKVKTR